MTRFETGSFETLIRLVDAGVGLTLLPELTVRHLLPEVRRAPGPALRAPVPTRQVSFVFGRDRLRGAIADALVTTLMSRVPADPPPARRRRGVVRRPDAVT